MFIWENNSVSMVSVMHSCSSAKMRELRICVPCSPVRRQTWTTVPGDLEPSLVSAAGIYSRWVLLSCSLYGAIGIVDGDVVTGDLNGCPTGISSQHYPTSACHDPGWCICLLYSTWNTVHRQLLRTDEFVLEARNFSAAHVPWPGQTKRQQARHIPTSLACASFFFMALEDYSGAHCRNHPQLAARSSRSKDPPRLEGVMYRLSYT